MVLKSKPQRVCRIYKYRPPKLKRMRSFLYKGTRITVFKAHRFEWQIELLKDSMIKICGEKKIHDCTSRLSYRYTVEDAKSTVDGILSPFFYGAHHQN